MLETSKSSNCKNYNSNWNWNFLKKLCKNTIAVVGRHKFKMCFIP